MCCPEDHASDQSRLSSFVGESYCSQRSLVGQYYGPFHGVKCVDIEYDQKRKDPVSSKC